MKILAIRLARLGDIVLLLPALTCLKERVPAARLTFLTDVRWLPLVAMCPAIDEVLTMDRLAMRDGPRLGAVSQIYRVAGDIRERRFDAVVDFHGFRETNLMAWWSGAPRRVGFQRFAESRLGFCFNTPAVVEDKSLHVSQMFLNVVRALVPDAEETPRSRVLVLPPEAELWAAENLPSGPYAAFYIDAPVPERRWPEERFAALARHLTSKMALPVVMVSGTPHRFAQAFARSEGALCLSGLSIPQLAAVVAKARVWVSNDTGPMHLGPAFAVPTLGLFSIGLPEHFRPTGPRDRYIRRTRIEEITEEEVLKVVGELVG